MEQDPLDPLPPELQQLVLRHAPWSARATCRAFCRHIDSARTTLRLRLPPPPQPPWSSAQIGAVLARLPCLTSLSNALDRDHPTDIHALARPSLTQLHLSPCNTTWDGTPLSACAALTSLTIEMSGSLTRLPPLPSLASLRLAQCVVLADLRFLTAARFLQKLDLLGCISVVDLTPLSSCASLTLLGLEFCRALTTIAPLASCVALTHLNLHLCVGVRDVRPLVACVALRTLNLGSLSVDSTDVRALLQACPHLQLLR